MKTEYLKPRECALELGVTDTTIYNLIRKGKLKSSVIMDQVMVHCKEFEKFKETYKLIHRRVR